MQTLSVSSTTTVARSVHVLARAVGIHTSKINRLFFGTLTTYVSTFFAEVSFALLAAELDS